MTPDMKVTIAGVEFDNPLLTASGCCGYGEELAQFYPLSKLGGLVTKSITLEPRLGHPPPRTAETASGMLNAIGLANVGIEAFIRDKLPFLAKQKTRIIVNVAGATIDEYVEECQQKGHRVDKCGYISQILDKVEERRNGICRRLKI